MKRNIVIFCLVFVSFGLCNVNNLVGPDVYENLVTDWTYAYSMVSNIDISYNISSSNATVIRESVNILHGVDVPWNTTKGENLFICPITSFPLVIGYNVPVIGNGTLMLTRELIAKMLTNSSMRWNDPELVALNPSLFIVTTFIRPLLDKTPSTVNQLIMDYFFDNSSVSDGDWSSIASSRSVLVSGYSSVVSALSVSINSFAFFPYPIVKAYPISESINFAVLRNTDLSIVKYNDPIKLMTTISGDTMSVEHSVSTWPLNLFSYAVYDQDKLSCTSATDQFRFFHWVANNSRLEDRTIDNGFQFFDSNTYETMKQHMMLAKCQGSNPVLYYTNLSESKRSNVMFAVSCIFCALFIGIVIIGWVISDPKIRFKSGNLIIRSCVILGIALSFASFVAWWYPPSTDSICRMRIWFLNLGFTNVVVAVFTYALGMSVMYSSRKQSANMFTTYHIIAGYIGFILAEVTILLIWQFGEGIKSQEVDVDPIFWTRVYTCSSSNGYSELVQLCWFCVVAIFGCFVIFMRWREREYSQEDSRWLLMALYCQILLFVILMILTRINTWDDDALYPAYVSFFIIATSVVIFAFFLPNLIRKLNYIVKSSESGSNDRSGTVTSARMDSPSSFKEYELERTTSSRKVTIDMTKTIPNDEQRD